MQFLKDGVQTVVVITFKNAIYRPRALNRLMFTMCRYSDFHFNIALLKTRSHCPGSTPVRPGEVNLDV